MPAARTFEHRAGVDRIIQIISHISVFNVGRCRHVLNGLLIVARLLPSISTSSDVALPIVQEVVRVATGDGLVLLVVMRGHHHLVAALGIRVSLSLIGHLLFGREHAVRRSHALGGDLVLHSRSDHGHVI